MKKTSFFLSVLAVLVLSCTQRPKTLFKLISPDDSGISFTNTIYEDDNFNILTTENIYNGGGVGVGDFNSDGLQDLFFCGNMVPNRLYLNQGKLKFKDVTEQAQVNVEGRWSSGVSVVDINNDGLLDIYVSATMHKDSASRRNMLFVNQGIDASGVPVFKELAAQYKINYGGYSVMSAFFDYDLDGDLDLYVLTRKVGDEFTAYYREKVTDGTSNNNDKLYRNNNDGTFTDVTLQAGIKEEGYGLGIAVADFNNDHWPDLYISNDYITNDILYVNNRNGSFTNVTKKYLGHQSTFSMGNDAADFNNDAMPDIVTLDMLPENNYRKKTTVANKTYQNYINNEKFGYDYQQMRNMLHLNNGMSKGIEFSEIGQLAGMNQTEWSWSPLLADFDNDGWKDLLITNGYPKDVTDKDFSNYRNSVGKIVSMRALLDSIPIVKIPHYAFKNNGDLTFADVSDAWGLNEYSFGNGAIFADLDNDGDLDYVVSNLNDPAFVFENQLNDNKDEKNKPSYLKIKLKGSKNNINGVGAKATLAQAGNFQFEINNVYRGFLSSVENGFHFGLGSNSKIDSLLIEWPDGKTQIIKNVQANQTLVLDYNQATSNETQWNVDKAAPLFTKNNSIHFKHEEEDVIDFNNQRTIPHKFSQNGPSLAVGDVDGNGTDDVVIGASANYPTTVIKQKTDGSFIKPSTIGDDKKIQDDAGLLLFDADNDGDLDLYIASGGSPYARSHASCMHRFYVNDGKGQFKLKEDAIPKIYSVSSCVRASDFDADGDLDLFVGGRIAEKGYPLPGESHILKNDHGIFTDVTTTVAEGLQNSGMINDALWTDFDNDGKTDLIVVGEFMPVTFYKNNGKEFKCLDKTGIENDKGWLNSIVGADFDADGDIDYVVGNWGLNNSYGVSKKYPLTLFAKDFDGNESIDPVMACYVKTSMSDTTRRLFPTHFWDELNSQSPLFRRKFTRYREYAKVTAEQLFTEKEMKDCIVMEANNMNTSYIENVGNGQFKIKALPIQTQFAPVNGMAVDDFDNDGNLDVAMVGNNYANEVFVGKYDAFTGLLLMGDGKGNFKTNNSKESGFYVPTDARALASISIKGKAALLATQNRDSIECFSLKSSSEKYIDAKPLDSFAEIELKDGRKQKFEFYYGAGYLSQSPRRINVSQAVKVKVTNYSGKSREVLMK